MKLPHATTLNQIAYVTHDIEQAITFWTGTMGVGPFLVLRDIQFEASDYLGETRPITYSAAIAYSGDLCVEIIEPNGPSIFADWLAEGKSGVQHLCVFTDDFAATAAEVTARGGRRLQGGLVGGGELAYFAMGGDQNIILEVARLSPEALGMFDMIKAAGANWDGVQRIIPLDSGIVGTVLP